MSCCWHWRAFPLTAGTFASTRLVRNQQQEGPEMMTDGSKREFVGSLDLLNTQKTMFTLKNEQTPFIHAAGAGKVVIIVACVPSKTASCAKFTG